MCVYVCVPWRKKVTGGRGWLRYASARVFVCRSCTIGTGSQQEAGAHCGRDSCARFPARDRQAVDRGAAHRRAASRTEISSSPRLDGHGGVAAAWTRSAGLRIGAITTPGDPWDASVQYWRTCRDQLEASVFGPLQLAVTFSLGSTLNNGKR